MFLFTVCSATKLSHGIFKFLRPDIRLPSQQFWNFPLWVNLLHILLSTFAFCLQPKSSTGTTFLIISFMNFDMMIRSTVYSFLSICCQFWICSVCFPASPSDLEQPDLEASYDVSGVPNSEAESCAHFMIKLPCPSITFQFRDYSCFSHFLFWLSQSMKSQSLMSMFNASSCICTCQRELISWSMSTVLFLSSLSKWWINKYMQGEILLGFFIKSINNFFTSGKSSFIFSNLDTCLPTSFRRIWSGLYMHLPKLHIIQLVYACWASVHV